MPGYSDTLACRLCMYVFNYKPFVDDYSFISGEQNKNWTPDVTKCDLFIDWYAKRFLSASDSDGLGKYSADDSLSFSYLRSTSETPTRKIDIKHSEVGNLVIGGGTPTLPLNGEDAYISGTFEVGGNTSFGNNVNFNNNQAQNFRLENLAM
jgi:hypothetical protein